MKHKSKWLKILLPIVAVAVAAAIGVGVFGTMRQSSAEPVNVYPFTYIGMTEYWADSQESYGPVTTDHIQTIFLSDTQTVTQILVSPGDTVQKGDLLMVFDTTLSDLALERERLNVEKLKLQLEDARDELTEIRNMKPMVIPTTPEEEPTEPDLGMALTEPYRISQQTAYDGSSRDKALICWLSSGTAIDDGLFEAIRLKAEEYQEKNAPAGTTPEETVPGETIPQETESQAEPLWFFPTEDPSEPTEESTAPSEEVTEPSEEPTEPSEEPTEPSEAPTEPSEEPTEPSEEPTEPSEAPTEPSEPMAPTGPVYVVFKMTQDDMSLGSTLVWQGFAVTHQADTDTYRFEFFDASTVTDHTLVPTDTPAPTEPEIDYGSGFTAAQIAEMRSAQEKIIKDLEFQVRMAEADYKIKQTEVDTGEVRAQIDGQVVSVLSEEEARITMQPILKVSGGGGFYIEGTVSELEKDNLVIGQEVTVNDWNTGMVYTGTIQSIGDAPSSDGYWNGMGNPNASYYPFTVFVDGSADLQEGYYASVVFTSATAENGIYLENPFLRTEGGKSYVYVQGEDGTLEQRFVTTGKSLWGSYTEILEGLSETDLIAFPYGKNIKVGAQTRESDLSELYDY